MTRPVRHLRWLLASAVTLSLLAWHRPVFAEQFTGRVVSVADGDTVGMMRDGREVRIRLEGIDCPENGQDFGTRAKDLTSSLIFGRTIVADIRTVDRYGRLVARLTVDGQDVSLALVRAGLAWHFKQYSKDPVLAEAETAARAARLGLWAQPNPVAPWLYRRPTSPPSRTGGPEPTSAPARAVATESPSAPVVYVGNSDSKVLHAPGCQHYRCKHCTVRFASVEAAQAAGYRKHSGGGGCIN